jgi:hypothetical protein
MLPNTSVFMIMFIVNTYKFDLFCSTDFNNFQNHISINLVLHVNLYNNGLYLLYLDF